MLISCNKEAKYNYVGEFDYMITNQTDFENTYLHESFGYVVGDLNIPGIEAKKLEDLPDDKDYVIVYNHPAKLILINSKNIRGEGLDLEKKPIEVIVDDSITKNKLFIYQLDKKNKYRLLLP